MRSSRRGTLVDPGSGARFDVFLVGAVGAVLVTRGYLAATGYPQVGGGRLHVAHVLWGGLGMAVALVLAAARSGPRARGEVALLGGIGFGLFIDEVGKFVTKDTDYFFRPAFAIMYTVLVLLVVAARTLERRRDVSDRAALVHAAAALSDLERGELDESARAAVLRRLDRVTERADTAAALRGLLTAGQAAPPPRFSPDRWARAVRRRGDAALRALLRRRRLVRVLAGVLGALAGLTVLATLFSTTLALLLGQGSLPDTPAAVSLASSTLSSLLLVVGLVALARGRTGGGLRLVRAGVLVDLLVTNLLTFATAQLGGLPDLAVNLLLLAVVGTALRVHATAPAESAGSAPRAPARV